MTVTIGDYIYFSETNTIINKNFFDIYSKYLREKNNQKTILKTNLKKKMSKLKQIIIEVTQNCNLQCKYCVYSKNYPYYREKNKKNMEIKTAVKGIYQIYNLIKKRKNKKIIIGFYGGEPLMNFIFIKKLVEFSNKVFNDWDINFVITTNGTLLDEEKIRFLVNNRFGIAISLDGPKANHDKKRVLENGRGSFDTVFQKLELIKNINKEYYMNNVSFIITFSPELSLNNVYQFYTREQMVNRNKIKLNFVNNIWTMYYQNFPYNPNKLKKELTEITKVIVEKKKKKKRLYPIEKEIWRILVEEMEDKLKNTNLIKTCLFDQKIFIDVEGAFHVCEKINGNFSIGNTNEGFNWARMEEMLEEFKIVTRKECYRCEFKYLCFTCFATLAADGTFKIDKSYCEDFKRNIIRRLNFYVNIKNTI